MNSKDNLDLQHLRRLFETLKNILADYGKELLVLVDQEDTYYVEVSDDMSAYNFFFGAVQIRADYVTFHFAGFPKLPELLRIASSDFSIIHNIDGGNYLVFKTITTSQLSRLKRLLEVYCDLDALFFTLDE